MNNKLIATATAQISDVLNEDRDTLEYISDFLAKGVDDRDNRNLIGNHSLIGGTQQTVMERLFEDSSFEWGESINKKVLTYLNKLKIMKGRDKVVRKIIQEVPVAQTERVAALIALRVGGAEIIKKHNLYDLSKVSYPVTLQCGLCGKSSPVNYSVENALAGAEIQDPCPECKHNPSVECSCEYCSSSHVVFDMASVVSSRVDAIVESTNKAIALKTDEKKIIDFDVDLTSLLSRFLAFRGGMTKDADKVVNKAVEVFKATNKFEFNTYKFVQNVLSDESKVGKVAGELIRSGFYYKKGITLKKTGGKYPKVKLITADSFPSLYLLENGELRVSEVPIDGDFGCVNFFNIGDIGVISVGWDGEFFAYDEFAVNQWALEHLSHGAVYSTQAAVQKSLPGKIITDEVVRGHFISELKRTNDYIFPNIKIASLVQMDDALKFLNSTSATLLENFEAALVAFGEDFEPKRVYVHEGHSAINLFNRLIEPNLTSAGIEVVYI